MNSADEKTLKNGNKRNNGRDYGSKNKTLLEIQRIGEENCLSLYNMQLDIAMNAPLEERIQAQQFLLNKILPNAKGCRLIKVDLPDMTSIQNIKDAEATILKNVCDGNITVEEGEKLFSMAEQARKTIETNEIMVMFNDMNNRLKEMEKYKK